MLIRIVKLSFQEVFVPEFLENFSKNKFRIRNFKGCNALHLLQDTHDNNQFFTYSLWDSEADLNAYRKSALFKDIWANTKPFFSKKPEAWSTTALTTL